LPLVYAHQTLDESGMYIYSAVYIMWVNQGFKSIKKDKPSMNHQQKREGEKGAAKDSSRHHQTSLASSRLPPFPASIAFTEPITAITALMAGIEKPPSLSMYD
jgi:hypothetical protein